MLILLTLVHVVVSLFLILVVLLQQGKGADLSVFGGGGTQAAFGARGATTLLHKLTVTSFVLFILTTMGIGIFKAGSMRDGVLSGLPEAVEESVEQTESPLAPTPMEETDAAAGVDEPAAPAESEGAAETPAEEPADGGPPADGDGS